MNPIKDREKRRTILKRIFKSLFHTPRFLELSKERKIINKEKLSLKWLKIDRK